MKPTIFAVVARNILAGILIFLLGCIICAVIHKMSLSR
jgi:hypothetical protein